MDEVGCSGLFCCDAIGRSWQILLQKSEIEGIGATEAIS
jgi:hypothetical protein